MKQLLFILSLFLSLAVSAQKYPADFSTYGVHYPRGNFDSALHIPVLKDTITARDNSKYKDSAEIGIFQGELWYKAAKGYWKKGGNGGGTVDLSDLSKRIDSLKNGIVNIKWFNPNIGDSVTPAIDAFNAAKAVLVAKGGGTIYFPAGKYPAVDNNGWLVGQSNIKLIGEGEGLTVLLPAAGQVFGGLQMAPYRDAGWQVQPAQLYTYEDSAAIGQDYIVMKAGQDLSAFKPGTSIFINDGASYYDQLYGEHNMVDKVQGNRVYLKDNLSRDYTAARGSWAGTLTQAFTIPPIGQSAIAYMTGIPPVSPYYGVSINNNLFQVTAVTDTSATLLNMGKGNASGMLPVGSYVMKARAVILTPSTVHDVTVEEMTVIGRRKALNISNSYNTYFHNVQFKWLPSSDGGGLTIDGDDGKYATLDHCSVEAPYFFHSQIARSFVGFKAINTTFHNSSIDLTEFATGEIANCMFDEGSEIDSTDHSNGFPAITVGASSSYAYIHDNLIRVSNRSAAISTGQDIQFYHGNSGNATTIDKNTIYCNGCAAAIATTHNGAVDITNNKIFGAVSYLFDSDGQNYNDTTNQRNGNNALFGYINYLNIDHNTFGGYIDGINDRIWHNIAFTNNEINRFGDYSSSGAAYANANGNIIRQPDTVDVQRMVVRGNTFRHWNLNAASFNIHSIDSLHMDISLNYFYDNVGTGAKNSIITLFTPFDNRYNKSTGSSFTGVTQSIEATQQAYPYMGYTTNTNKKVGFQFIDNGDGTVSIQAAFINTAQGTLQTTEGQTLTTTEGETIIFN